VAVRNKFEHWRKTRQGRERIPDDLWKAAIELTGQYSLHQVSRWLRLNYADLKKRVHEAECIEPPCATFVPVNAHEVFVDVPCVVEMRRPDGSSMSVTLGAQAGWHLLELAKIFWGSRP
jgi:hypothetical protein